MKFSNNIDRDYRLKQLLIWYFAISTETWMLTFCDHFRPTQSRFENNRICSIESNTIEPHLAPCSFLLNQLSLQCPGQVESRYSATSYVLIGTLTFFTVMVSALIDIPTVHFNLRNNLNFLRGTVFQLMSFIFSTAIILTQTQFHNHLSEILNLHSFHCAEPATTDLAVYRIPNLEAENIFDFLSNNLNLFMYIVTFRAFFQVFALLAAVLEKNFPQTPEAQVVMRPTP